MKLLAIILMLMLSGSAATGEDASPLKYSNIDKCLFKLNQLFFVCEQESRARYAKMMTGTTSPKSYEDSVDYCLITSAAEARTCVEKAESELKIADNYRALNALEKLYSYWKTIMKVDSISRGFTESQEDFESRMKGKWAGFDNRVDTVKEALEP